MAGWNGILPDVATGPPLETFTDGILADNSSEHTDACSSYYSACEVPDPSWFGDYRSFDLSGGTAKTDSECSLSQYSRYCIVAIWLSINQLIKFLWHPYSRQRQAQWRDSRRIRDQQQNEKSTKHFRDINGPFLTIRWRNNSLSTVVQRMRYNFTRERNATQLQSLAI